MNIENRSIKVHITPEELLAMAVDQVQFLKDFCKIYDEGNYKYGPLIATRLRVLFYDSRNCTSVYTHLKQTFKFQNTQFMDTRNVEELHFENENNCPYVSSFMCQYKLKHYPDSPPILTPCPRLNAVNCFLDFKNWWKKATVIHWNSHIMSRNDVVCSIANQDGGAHVDNRIYESIAELKRGNAPSLSIRIPINGKYKLYTAKSNQILYAIIRTIANEAIIAFDKHILPSCFTALHQPTNL